ncbi:Heat shock protein. Metallo peptidase. MEROPS family M48B [Cyclobacterium lianum]|uniref:Protease HtpX homolog n=1 Tax=Cyclobacterium lianum TaxID=388280 RepID=A0A1M7QHM4_9BACT|nr:M48 family metallopeptidase [Cyclobacterium lianum]SHN30238.1 Heat shock protein. Metallo peptidase. MEROPS family M48B [Cyclobacterium lianum]
MAGYIGIQTQIQRNNTRSVLLLLGFPLLLLGAVYAFLYFTLPADSGNVSVNDTFVQTIPGVLIAVGIWFVIAYFFHSKMISSAAGARPLERKDNLRVYNLVENLCISKGMRMPKVNIIEDQALNAFASGINEKTYTVTLTRGIIDTLNDEELEGVIAHELMHIRNKDVRLLIISIIFVGIFSFIAQILFRSMLFGAGRRRGKNDNRALLIAMVIAFVAFLLSMLFRFAISRKREYMADSGAAEMTKKPWALAAALRKISGNYRVETVKSDDVAELFIENRPDKSSGLMSAITGLFATHPPIEKRIAILEQF